MILNDKSMTSLPHRMGLDPDGRVNLRVKRALNNHNNWQMKAVQTIDNLQEKRKKLVELDAIERHPLGEKVWMFKKKPSLKKTLVEKQMD